MLSPLTKGRKIRRGRKQTANPERKNLPFSSSVGEAANEKHIFRLYCKDTDLCTRPMQPTAGLERAFVCASTPCCYSRGSRAPGSIRTKAKALLREYFRQMGKWISSLLCSLMSATEGPRMPGARVAPNKLQEWSVS